MKLSKTRSQKSKRTSRTLRTIYLAPSSRLDKKYMVKVGSRWIHFGQKGASDFTLHHDASRKENYLHRHQAKENWSHAGMNTAGFWSRWLLWNKPSKTEAVRYIEHKFNIHIRNSKNTTSKK